MHCGRTRHCKRDRAPATGCGHQCPGAYTANVGSDAWLQRAAVAIRAYLGIASHSAQGLHWSDSGVTCTALIAKKAAPRIVDESPGRGVRTQFQGGLHDSGCVTDVGGRVTIAFRVDVPQI